MARSEITIIANKLEINDVSDILVTSIVSENGEYVREIRIMGTSSDTDTGVPLTLTLRLKSPDKTSISFVTPELEY